MNTCKKSLAYSHKFDSISCTLLITIQVLLKEYSRVELSIVEVVKVRGERIFSRGFEKEVEGILNYILQVHICDHYFEKCPHK